MLCIGIEMCKMLHAALVCTCVSEIGLLHVLLLYVKFNNLVRVVVSSNNPSFMPHGLTLSRFIGYLAELSI